MVQEERGTKVGILIPAHNEAKTIRVIIQKCKKYGKIIVLDDGSSDRTPIVSKKSGAIVFSHKRNFGVGVARKSLFAIVNRNKAHLRRYCRKKDLNKLSRIPNFDVIINIDADGELMPKDIPKLVDPILEGKQDLVVGKRNLNQYPFYKRFGNELLTLFTRLLFNIQVSDSQCGFKAMSPDLTEKIKLSAPGYAIETDILIEASHIGARIEEVRVGVGEYTGGSFLDNFWTTGKEKGGADVLDGIRNLYFLIKKRMKL